MNGYPGATRSHGASRKGKDMSDSTNVPDMAVVFTNGSFVHVDGHHPYGAHNLDRYCQK